MRWNRDFEKRTLYRSERCNQSTTVFLFFRSYLQNCRTTGLGDPKLSDGHVYFVCVSQENKGAQEQCSSARLLAWTWGCFQLTRVPLARKRKLMMGGNNMGDINYKTMSTATRMAQTPNVLLQHTFFLTKLCNLPSDGLQRHSGGSKHEHITDRDVSFTFVCLSGVQWKKVAQHKSFNPAERVWNASA